ncbi:hypothetical protein H0H93_000579, partial [Arthromyces matolae]
MIGNCWRSLPLDQKRVWEVKAKHAKAEHKARYPDYRFRPVHNKNKNSPSTSTTTSSSSPSTSTNTTTNLSSSSPSSPSSPAPNKKTKIQSTPVDERRCEEVAQLLLEGKKGDELAAAVRKLDLMREERMQSEDRSECDHEEGGQHQLYMSPHDEYPEEDDHDP